MGPSNTQQPALDRCLIDRLVDGELAGPDRCDLLARLDTEPGGWRLCALAFLEAQCWREALEAAHGVRKRHQRHVRWRMAIATGAAPILVALGWLLGASSKPTPTPLSRNDIVQAPAKNVVSPRVNPVAPLPAPSPKPGADVADEVWQVGYLQLAPPSTEQPEPVRVPLLAGPGLDERWLRGRSPALPGSLRRQWEGKGFRVQERRHLVSLEVEQGRFVAIPVNDVDIEYVGFHPL